jgi:cold shock CspA family protein
MGANETRRTGRCASWFVATGWGWLEPDVPGPSWFCHVRGLRSAPWLAPGDRVSFVASTDRQGRPTARDVVVEQPAQD